MYSAGALRQSGNFNLTNGNDFPLISEEDLLSNIDRMSRLLPQAHLDMMSEEDLYNRQLTPSHRALDEQVHYQRLLAKVREQASIIEALRGENFELKKHLAERDVFVEELEARIVEL